MRPATEQSKPSAVVSAGNTWPSDELWYRQNPEADHHHFFGASKKCKGGGEEENKKLRTPTTPTHDLSFSLLTANPVLHQSEADICFRLVLS